VVSLSVSEPPNCFRKRKENPLWSEILQHSWEKVEKWAGRVLEKWNFKISEVVKAGRQPQLRSASVCAVYRDSGREKEVWKMACLMQHFDAYFLDTLTEAQYRSLAVQWSCGRLDSRLLPEVLAMRADFKPQDLAFLVQDLSSQAVQNFLVDASVKETTAQLEKMMRKLKSEQASFRREAALRKAADGNYLGMHATWQEKVDEAVDDLWEMHQPNYQIFSSPDLPSAHRSLIQARVDLVGLEGCSAATPDQIPTISVWNLPMLGATASTVIQAAADVIATDLAHFPQLSIHIVIPPNQAVFGQTRLGEAAEVQEHQDRWWSALLEPARELDVVKARCLGCQTSLYQNKYSSSWCYY